MAVLHSPSWGGLGVAKLLSTLLELDSPGQFAWGGRLTCAEHLPGTATQRAVLRAVFRRGVPPGPGEGVGTDAELWVA